MIFCYIMTVCFFFANEKTAVSLFVVALWVSCFGTIYYFSSLAPSVDPLSSVFHNFNGIVFPFICLYMLCSMYLLLNILLNSLLLYSGPRPTTLSHTPALFLGYSLTQILTFQSFWKQFGNDTHNLYVTV
jgi:hypothetical protein